MMPRPPGLRILASLGAAVWRRLTWEELLYLPVGLLMLGCGWWTGLHNRSAAMVTIDLHEADGIAFRGGVLDILATVDEARLCDTAVRRWLWRLDPQYPGYVEWIYLGGMPFRPPTPLGLDHYHIRVPIPAWVEPGWWHYLGQADEQCPPLWLHEPRASRDFLVRIDDPTPANPASLVAPPGAIELLPAGSDPVGGQRTP